LFYFKYKVFSKRRLGDGEEGEEEEMGRGGTRRQGDKGTRGRNKTPNS
jgi:hypothetical protein